MEITLTWLKQNKACKDQIKIFEKEWGEKVEINRENLIRAKQLNFDLYWFIRNLAWEKYEQEVFLFREEFEKAVNPFREQYKQIKTLAYEEINMLTVKQNSESYLNHVNTLLNIVENIKGKQIN